MRIDRGRTKTTLIWFLRHLLNPVMLRSSGKPNSYAAVLHHTGRLSGREFRTPVVPVAIDGQVVIELPYGDDVQWLRNILAAGSATIDWRGEVVRVANLRVEPAAQVIPRLDAEHRASWARHNFEKILVADLVREPLEAEAG